ncbi:hypothetical protein JTB14_031422 [Gonioctena quinquepunctata]|nr:hypothetical protein JTB14_031422 [Gonioctena quinquepunctata]
MEKAKQEIEIKKLELDNQLKLLRIEHEFHEQEINETRECESIKSTRSLHPTVRVLTPISQPPSSPKTTDIQNWMNEIEIQPIQDQEQPRKEDPPTVPRERMDIQLLCKTLSETLQKATSRPEDNFRLYRFMEKDFPIFDGNPAEWPTVKLQKCLRGEAKSAVAGMMMCPSNINLVINTLEMRFGRPDQIIETLITQTITRGDWMKYDYSQGLPFQNITSRPMILLGQDNINLTVARKVCQGPENTPIATKTHLGWILHKPTDFGKTLSQFSFHIYLREQADEKLHDLV